MHYLISRVAFALCIFGLLSIEPAAMAQAPSGAEPSVEAAEAVSQPRSSRKRRAARTEAPAAAAPRQNVPVSQLIEKANSHTVSIISAGLTGTFLTLAADLMNVLDDDTNLRILPIVTKGAAQNARDIILLRGVDLALVRTDSFEAVKRQGDIPDIDRQVAYIARLHNDEMHIVTRKEITDIRQLAGKKVNIELRGNGGNFSSRVIFERLGITAELTEFDQATSLEKLRKGELDANIFWAGKPVTGIARFTNDGRFHLLPVAYDDRIRDFYYPATLSSADYPNLIPPGQVQETIAAGVILAAYNWPEGSDRYRKLERFTQAFFAKFEELQKAPRHPKWQEVNLSANIATMRRFKPAQIELDKLTGASQQADATGQNRAAFTRFLDERRKTGAAAPATPAERDALFQDFLQWQKNRP